MTLLILACLVGALFTVHVFATAPRSTARYVTDGDSDRHRRHSQVEPLADGEVLPVIGP